MTPEDFNAQREGLECRYCRTSSGLETRQHEGAANHLGLYCRHCDTWHPVNGVMWLKHSDRVTRDSYPETVAEVWAKWNEHCFSCGYDRAELKRLGVGLDRHHTRRYAKTKHSEGFLVPVCTGCHPFLNAIQRMADRLARARGLPEIDDDTA